MPVTDLDWANRFRNIWAKFSEMNKAEMPKVTAHVCRHTFCSNVARGGMNPETLTTWGLLFYYFYYLTYCFFRPRWAKVG